jgi:hypothetical protein
MRNVAESHCPKPLIELRSSDLIQRPKGR